MLMKAKQKRMTALARRRITALIMSVVMLSSIFSMGAIMMEYDATNEHADAGCCGDLHDLCEGETGSEDVELPDIEVPNIEMPDLNIPELENGYNQSDSYENNSNTICDCECEYDCDYYDCVCECDCAYIDGYIEIMPLTNTFTALQAAITAIPMNGSGTINLTGNINMTGTIAINQGRNVTINGGGHTLTQTGNGRHFNLSGAGAGTLHLNNVRLTVPGNTTLNHGGVTVSPAGTLVMNAGSIISGNTTTNGGGVANSGTFIMNDGEISGNRASNGGAVTNSGTFIMRNGSLINNTASHCAGGVRITSSGSFTMYNGLISGNTAGHGGGVRALGGNATFTMRGGAIRNNNAIGITYSGNGGGIHSSGTVNIHAGEITGNTAVINGGGINSLGTLVIHNGTISGNTANNGGGIGNTGPFTMHNGVISGNTANVNGGGVNNSNNTFTMHNGTIHNNTANGSGGGVSNSNTFIMNNNSTIRNNIARTSGGGVSMSGTGNFTMNNGIIRDNTADTNGGGVNKIGSGAFVMNNGTISGNRAYGTAATSGGGGVHVGGFGAATYIMHNGVISNNIAANNGGGINAAGGTTTLNNGTISGNRANGNDTVAASGGGGLNWTTQANLTAVTINPAVTFANNYAVAGLRIDDALNLAHNLNAGGRINPNTWTYAFGIANNLHAFNNFDIRTVTGTVVHIYHDVIFNLNGGVGSFPDQRLRHNTTAAAPVTDPTFEYHTFLGWYTEATGGIPFDFSTPIIADTVVHARWESYVAITFELHGGSGSFPIQRIPRNTIATAPIMDPAFEYHTFLGWYTEATDGVPFDFTDPITADTVVHARWESYVAITFDLHGGTGSFPIQRVPNNTTAAEPATIPTQATYIFAGWYTEAEGGVPFDFNTPITEDTIIHARWEPEYRYIRVYYMIDNEYIEDVIFNPKMSNYPDGYTYRVGDDFMLTGTRAIDRNALPGDNVYIFEGWYVFVGIEYAPAYLDFDKSVLSGSFIVPSSATATATATPSGLVLSASDVLSPLNDIDLNDWENQILLVAVWTIYEAEEEETTPPATGGGNRQGRLPATGISNNVTLWTILLSLSIFAIVGIVAWIVVNKKITKATNRVF